MPHGEKFRSYGLQKVYLLSGSLNGDLRNPSFPLVRSFLSTVKKTMCKFPVKNPRAGRATRDADCRSGGRPERKLLSIRGRRSLMMQELRRMPGAFCRLPPRPDTLF